MSRPHQILPLLLVLSKKKKKNLITTSLPPQFLFSLPLGLVFVVGSFFLFSFLSFPPFLSISNKILACLRLLLQFLLFSDSPLQIAAPRTYHPAIVVSDNACELMERHLFIEIGRVNCLIRCTTFRVHEAE
ncbi:unnamed protein product [Citrullus colocynthis]|uniref:Uncharacterized protein n=1 Tax=Citrullus colocynthis TaxID=252529 RepID=A0ABP0ZFL5_9ROSI